MGKCVQGIEFRTLIGEFTGSANAIYPTIVQIAPPLTFTVNYLLVGLQLSSSLTIFGANKGGIVLVIGQTRKALTISDALQTPITHISGPNSISSPSVVPIPTSKVTSLSFGAYGIGIPANTQVALYGFADATSGNDLFAICSLQLIPYLQ